MARIFRPAAQAMVRLAVLPRADASQTRVDLRPDEPGYDKRLTDYLRTAGADPLVREALAVSSGSLADTVDKVESGRPVELSKLERAALSVTRYLLRMTGRPTPFGLLAGVQRAEFGGAASVRLGDKHRKSVRADNAWLAGILLPLRRNPAILGRCTVTVNNLCEVRGDRLVLPYVRATADRPETDTNRDREISVRRTPLLSAILAAAHRPISYPGLKERLLTEYPDAPDAALDGMLGELVDREFLLTDLFGRRDLADQLAMLNERLAGVDEPVVAALRDVSRRLASYQAEPPGKGLAAWRETSAAMRELYPVRDRSPMQVDLRIDADIRLPQAVADELAKVGEVLWRLAPPHDGHPQLTEYHGAFMERYGPGTLVPVLEALDVHRGIGPPASYQMPRGERGAPHMAENPYPPEREQLVADRLNDVLRQGGDEFVLDDELVDRLAHDESVAPPLSLDLCAELHAESTDALDRGEFQLAISAGAGSMAAGAMAGRFADLLDDDETLAAVVGDKPDPTGPLVAQLYFQPHKARFDNVALVPKLLPYTVPTGAFADPDGDDVLDVRDLLLGATEQRLFLYHRKTEREVVVVTPHMLQFRTSAPNVARFLTAMAMSGTRLWTPWDWGRLGALPQLPRVRYRRTVLTSARWQPDGALRDRTLSTPHWLQQLKNWRERLRVPDHVRVNVMDHHVDVDLTVPLHQQLFRTQLNRTDPVVIRESSQLSDGWLRGHANELVIPLVSTRGRSPIHVSTGRPAPQPRHFPGGEWLFAKVYAVPDTHDKLLRRELPAVPDFVDRWFFMRYLDPKAHLRLRFHGPSERLNAELLPQLNEWAARLVDIGAISGFLLDTYEPEVDRYGGPAAIDDAERLFQADSRAVVDQLAELASGRLSWPAEVLAAANFVDLLASLGDWDWPAWVLDTLPVELQHHSKSFREAAFQLVDPGREWSGLQACPAVLAGWAQRAGAAAAYGKHVIAGKPDTRAINGILHMHANRLLGLDRTAEQNAYGILRTSVRAYVGRLRSRG